MFVALGAIVKLARLHACRHTSLLSLAASREWLRLMVVRRCAGMRNAILRINSGAVRKLIPLPYERNMRALELLLQVAPVRYDLPSIRSRPVLGLEGAVR